MLRRVRYQFNDDKTQALAALRLEKTVPDRCLAANSPWLENRSCQREAQGSDVVTNRSVAAVGTFFERRSESLPKARRRRSNPSIAWGKFTDAVDIKSARSHAPNKVSIFFIR